MARRLGVAAITTIGALLMLVTTGHAMWAGGRCGAAADGGNHCYALARWDPNVHKGVTNAWEYVTPEDVHFAKPTSFYEFVDMEMWVGWAEPGRIVEYPISGEPEYWIETGEVWNSEGCHYFTSSNGKGGDGYYSLAEQDCGSIRAHALFKIQKESSGEWCVYWNKNPNVCLDTSGGYVPNAPFTLMNSGMELSTSVRPTGIKGFVEAFAQGGKNDWWQGNRTADYIYTRGHATCVYSHKPGPGSVYFTAGGDCPESYEQGGGSTGLKWKEETAEEPRGAARRRLAESPEEESELAEEPPPPLAEEIYSLPEPGSPAPTSSADSFASYSPTGVRAKVRDKERTLEQIEGGGVSGDELEVATSSAPLDATGVAPLAAAVTPGQEAANHASAYVVEVERKPTLETYKGPHREILVREGGHPMAVPRAAVPAGFIPPYAEAVRMVYGARTGKLLQIGWGETAAEQARAAHRREMLKLKTEGERFRPKACQQAIAKHEEPFAEECEQASAELADYEAKLKADKAAEKSRLKAEKKQAHIELKEEAQWAKEHPSAARVASARGPSHPWHFDGEAALAYDEVAGPPNTATIAVRHNGRVRKHQGHRYIVRLRKGRSYTVTARGASFRCSRHIRARRAGEVVRLRWPHDCTRTSG